MDINSLTIPPELFYSKAPGEVWKPKKREVLTPKEVKKHFATTTTFKRKKSKTNSGPELGRIGKIRRNFIKKKILKKKQSNVLKEKSGNIIQKENSPTTNNNNSISLKPPTKHDERILLKEIKEKEAIIQKRMFCDQNVPRKRLSGSSFKFFKSKNDRDEENDPSSAEDNDLVPEIRDFSSQQHSVTEQILLSEKHSKKPETIQEVLVDLIPFEEEADVDLDGTSIVIESLLHDLDGLESETNIPTPLNDSSTATCLDNLIATLEGTAEVEKDKKEVKAVKVEVKQKAKFMGLDRNQLQIDAGQKKFGLVECKECGFSYNTNVPEDERIHSKHHQEVTTIPRFRGWTTEDALTINDWIEQNGRIIHIQPNHKHMTSEFVKEIVSKMELDFGIQDDYESHHVYIAAYDSKVVGLATVMDSVMAKKNEEEKCIRLGIKRLFVRPQFRRKGIAKAMLKTIAIMHHKGELLDLSQDLAFSTPTEDGQKLIANVTGTSNVFTFSS